MSSPLFSKKLWDWPGDQWINFPSPYIYIQDRSESDARHTSEFLRLEDAPNRLVLGVGPPWAGDSNKLFSIANATWASSDNWDTETIDDLNKII